MFHELSKRIPVGVFVALLTVTVPALAVKTYRTSNYGGAHQIWFEAEDFDERNPDTDQYYPVVEAPSAFGQAINRAGGAGGMIRWTFDIGLAGGKAGTWFFWARQINPNNQSDYMLVQGDPGDPQIPTGPPFPGGDSTAPFVNADDRIFEENVGTPPDNWAWGLSNHEEGQTKDLQNGQNTMYIFHRSGNNTVFWDVFMWTDSASYVPTDADYQNATVAPQEKAASSPEPKNGATVEATWASLAWTSATKAVSHNVYLGDNFQDVNNGTGNTFQGNTPSPLFVVGLGTPGDPYPGGLVPGTTYYWRIDEVNQADPSSPWKGAVWSFRIPPRKAYQPSPGDGAKYQDPGVTLKWTPGLGAKLHYVYFGDNRDTISNATGGAPMGTASYTPAGPLAKGKTYYWRVDEFDGGATHKGDVWSFTTLSDIPISDPNLIGWWKLDEGAGTIAVDWSGHGNHGQIRGNPQWVGGQDGGALDFDGNGDFIFTGKSASALGVEGAKPKTVTAWVYTRTYNNGAIFDMGARTDGQDFSLRTLTTVNQWRTQHWGAAADHDFTQPSQNVWVHFALVYTGTESTVYANGIAVSSKAAALDTSSANPFQIGCYGWQVNYFNGVIDDVRLYNKAVPPQQLQAVMRGDVTRAWQPNPATGSTSDVFRATTLNWSRGEKASQHDVYFGLDKAAVASADASDTTGVYRGRQSATSYTPPEGVQMAGGPYYWRVDEVNTDGTIAAGGLWSFSVADYALVDDFESYNDIAAGQPGSNLVYTTWLDGFGTTTNGSTMGYPSGSSLETANVHGGTKAVPLIYNNATASFSEVERTFAAQDWTSNGIQTLSLWFRGNAANVPGQLYVKINGVKVLYDGDATNLKAEAWQTWNITLASVSTNLQSVTRLAIGIETKGATGTLLLDDIRLYALPRQLVTPVQPNAAGLMAHYPLDGNTNDVAGAHNGTASAGATYGPGKTGQALAFNGSTYVDCGNPTQLDFGTGSWTVSAWVNLASSTGAKIVFSKGGDDAGGIRYVLSVGQSADHTVTLTVDDNVTKVESVGSVLVDDGQWHHIVGIRDGDRLRIYVDGFQDGRDVALAAGYNLAGTSQANAYIGADWSFANKVLQKFFTGAIDDVRIYNYALSQPEIAALAGKTLPFDKPF